MNNILLDIDRKVDQIITTLEGTKDGGAIGLVARVQKIEKFIDKHRVSAGISRMLIYGALGWAGIIIVKEIFKIM